jgi:hypothetical protein
MDIDKNTLDVEIEPDLGAPDFSGFADDEPIEITGVDMPKAKKEKIQAGELIAVCIGMSFNFIAARKGEHWKLSPDEAGELASATNDVIEEYMPDFETSPVVVLAAVGAGIMAPRLMTDMQIKAMAEKNQTDIGGGDAPENEPG